MTQTAKHTPGPWTPYIVNDKGNRIYQVRTVQPHNPAGTIGKHIATVNHWPTMNPDENAALIAAAPSLLAACKAMMLAEAMQTHGKRDAATMGLISAAIDAARTAIALAEKGGDA